MASVDGFYRRTGNHQMKKWLVGASITIAIGDIVQVKEGSGSIILGATGGESLGIALEASASGSTTPILIDEISPGDEFWGKVGTGTMAATELGALADIKDEDEITLTESNNDFLIKGWDGSSTDRAFVVFKNIVNSGG